MCAKGILFWVRDWRRNASIWLVPVLSQESIKNHRQLFIISFSLFFAEIQRTILLFH